MDETGVMTIRYSLIVPIYKNEVNIEDLLAAISGMHAELPDMEAIFVVDGSPDRSWEMLRAALETRAYPSRLVLLSRNFGSFAAIRTGMEQARGEYMAVLAADLQEPPELVPQIFAALSSGLSDVVVGERVSRQDPPLSRFLSATYWKLYKRLINPDTPAGGMDIFGCTKEVAGAILTMRENNTSLMAQVLWVGYRRTYIPYQRRQREKGTSAWTFWKKVKYLLDSVFSFSDLPIMILLWLGVLGVALSMVIGFVTLFAKLLGLITVPGYTALILVVLMTFSVLLLSLGIIGCYVWRCFENTKQRPLTLIQRCDVFDGTASGEAGSGAQASGKSPDDA